MGLDLEQMDAEPAAPEPPVTPPEPQATPPAPPIAEPVVAPASSVTPVVTEPKHEVIPLAAHLEQRKQLNARIAELEAERAARAAPEAPKPVDFMEDPKGYVDQKIQTAVNSGQATAAELQAFREQQQINALINEAGQAEAAFSKEHADYEAALEHVRSTRMAQLRLMDSDATEAQMRQVIAREEIMGIASAKQRGINPAELAYNYAKTLGYKAPVAAAPAPAAVPAVPATPVVAPAADVSAARSLGAGGGGGDATGEDEESEITSVLKARFRR